MCPPPLEVAAAKKSAPGILSGGTKKKAAPASKSAPAAKSSGGSKSEARDRV